MSATILEFPSAAVNKNRRIDDIVDEKLQHPDPDVLALWRTRVKAIFKNYEQQPFSFTVQVPEDINDDQLEQITLSIETTLGEYQKAINEQKYEMLNALCLLECRICEYELENEKDSNLR